MRLIAMALLVLASVAGLFGIMPVTVAQAAEGDYCFIEGTLQPGERDVNDVCQPTDPAVGFSCGNDLFYNGSQCVANNASCTVGTDDGVYQAGVCEPLPTPPTPTEPTAPVGFTIDPNAGDIPAGTQQPMCVNASPFIGGGVFVVSGTVLCYTGAGKSTGIYAYTDDGGSSSGWNPFDINTWDSLTMRDLYASDDISAQGTLSVFGGAQIYSLDGLSGVQVNNSGVLLGSSDLNGNTSTLEVTAEEIALSSSDGTSTSSLSVSAGNGISLVADLETGGPAVEIAGSIGATSTSRMGVLVTGDGQGASAAPSSGPADWADVLVASKSFTLDNGLGSGVIVNDYGVTVRSASVGTTYNEFGSGAGNVAGSSLTNVIGDGGAGSVSNFIGRAGDVGTTVVNEIGTAGGGGATTNRVGNTNALTSFTATAGTSSMVVIQGALDLSTGQGASTLTAPTQLVSGGSATSMVGAAARYASVDQNGMMTVINGVAPEASSSMYIVNGYGTTNGVTVTERNAVVSGGEERPTTMVLSDTGAHFSNSTNGDPVVVSGVNDGQGPFDATNVRQLDSGLASVAALGGLPAPQDGKTNSLGIAFGQHGSGSALALGGQSLIGDGFSLKYGAAVSYSSGLFKSSASVGVGMSW